MEKCAIACNLAIPAQPKSMKIAKPAETVRLVLHRGL